MKITLLRATFASVALATIAFAEDRAVLVGVDRYPNLPSATLQGCENDVDNMTSTLDRWGFKNGSRVSFKSEAATKEAILGAIRAAANYVKAGDRFVYVHSSHGSQKPNGEATLLTASSGSASFNGDITRDELKAALATVMAKGAHVTLIVDACHSEGIMTKGGVTGKRKVYLRKNLVSNPRSDVVLLDKIGEVVTFGNNNSNLGGGSKGTITQYVAAKWQQYAYENTIAGKRQGVFTYYLSQELTRLRSRGSETWAPVTSVVNEQVAKYTKDEQTPEFNGPNQTPFGGGSGGGSNNVTFGNFLGLYTFDNANPGALTLSVENTEGRAYSTDDSLRIKGHSAGEEYAVVQVTPNKAGFLIVLDRDAQDNVSILNFTASDDVEAMLDAAAVSAGKQIRLPGNTQSAYRYNYAGPEQIKALLFTNREAAKKALASLKSVGGGKFSRNKLSAKGPEEVTVTTASFYTADFRFNVVKE